VDKFTRILGILLVPGMRSIMQSNFGLRNIDKWCEWPVIGPAAQLVKSMHVVRRTCAQILNQKKADFESLGHKLSGAHARDMMGMLVEARMLSTGEGNRLLRGLSDDDVLDQMMAFMAAGHETSACSLSWTLWNLANDPESQQRLRDEVRSLLETRPRPSYRELQGLPWLNAVCSESLRLYPPLPACIRIAAEDTMLEEVFVPKGTLFYIPVRYINCNVDVWGKDAFE
jgi:cytochrome P450